MLGKFDIRFTNEKLLMKVAINIRFTNERITNDK